MQMAEIAAMRSTCFRANVGAILVCEGNPISMGYNGSAPGEEHCTGNDCPRGPTGGCVISKHAEENALLRGIGPVISGRPNIHLYCTYSPCISCSTMIVEYGVSRFFFMHRYRIVEGLQKILGNMEAFQITPSGTIIRERDRVIVEAESL